MRHPRRKGPPPRVQRAIDYFTRDLWLKDVKNMPWLGSIGLRASRVLVLSVRGFRQHRVLVQAAALTYYTVLSIVPMLAVSFAVARGMGKYDELKDEVVVPAVDRFLGANDDDEELASAGAADAGEVVPAEGAQPASEPGEDALGGAEPRDSEPDGGAPTSTGAEPGLEPAAEPVAESVGDASQASGGVEVREAFDKILELVDETKDAPIGGIGLLVLLYAAIKLLGAVEGSLNEIWGVQRGRSFMRRISDYLSIVVVTPILLLTGTVATAWVRRLKLRSMWGDVELDLAAIVLPLLPVFVICLGLGFAYFAMPNTRVRVQSAALGGVVAAILWLGSQYLFFELQLGIASNNALYAGFAAIPILLVWIFLSWSIFLIGAEASYAHQSVPLHASIARMGKVDHAFREGLAVRLAARVSDAFLNGRKPMSVEEIAGELSIVPRAVGQVCELLVARRILTRVDLEEEDHYLPARDPEQITVVDVLNALKVEDGATDPPVSGRLDERIDRILDGLESEARLSLHNHTMEELARSARADAEALAEGQALADGQADEERAAELREAPDGP